jgi:hypothetical protein
MKNISLAKSTLKAIAIGLATSSIIAIPAASSQAETVNTIPNSDIYALVNSLVASPPLGRDVVERALGIKMSLVSEGTFNDYSAHGVDLGRETLELVDFREPSTNGGAKRGPMLALKLGDSCVARSEVLARYEGLVIADVPRDRSANEQTYYARQEPWGTLSFGFQVRSPDCLKTVVFSLRGPGQGPSLLR